MVSGACPWPGKSNERWLRVKAALSLVTESICSATVQERLFRDRIAHPVVEEEPSVDKGNLIPATVRVLTQTSHEHRAKSERKSVRIAEVQRVQFKVCFQRECRRRLHILARRKGDITGE